MLKYISNGFRSLKQFKTHIEKLALPALMRLFTKRSKHYESLLSRADSFIDVIEATAASSKVTVDIGNVDIDEAIKKAPVKRTRTKKDTSRTTINKNTAIPISKFVTPNRKTLARNTKLLAELDSALDELEIMDAKIGSLSVGKNTPIGKKFMSSAKEMYELMDAKASALSEALQELSYKHEPESMKEMRETAWKYILGQLPAGTYGEPSNDLYVTAHDAVVAGNESSDIQFTSLMYLPDLDEDSYKNSDLTIALTGVVRQKNKDNYNMQFYLTSLNTVNPLQVVPGMFDTGTQLTGKTFNSMKSSLKREVGTLLSLNSMKADIGAVRFKGDVTQQYLRNSPIMDRPYVLDIDIRDHKYIIVLLTQTVTERIAENIFKGIWPLLHGLSKLGTSRRRKGVLKTYVYTLEQDDSVSYLKINKVHNMAG